MKSTLGTKPATKISWKLAWMLLQLLSMVALFPVAGLAATSQFDSNSEYFFAAAAYNSGNLESVNFSIDDIHEPNPATVAIPSSIDGAALSRIASINVATPENVTVAKVQFFVNGVQEAETATAPYAFPWDTSSLTAGDYAVSVRATDAVGNVVVSDNLVVKLAAAPIDSAAPQLGINPVDSPTVATSQTISGFVSDNVAIAGVTVQVGSGAPAAAVISGSSWSFALTGLPVGSSTVTVRATDGAGNVATATATIAVSEPPAPVILEPLSIADAQTALKAATGNLIPSDTQLARLDVGPFVNGKSTPDGMVNTVDVVVILLKLVGKI